MAMPTPSAIAIGDNPMLVVTSSPHAAAIRCPPTTLYGRANGLAGAPKTNAQLAPKGAISNGATSAAFAIVSSRIVRKAPKPANAARRHGLASSHAMAWLRDDAGVTPESVWVICVHEGKARGRRSRTGAPATGVRYFLNFAASSEPLVALPALYECAPTPASFPPCTTRYSLRIGLPAK